MSNLANRPNLARHAEFISRRNLLLAGSGLAATSLSGCSFLKTDPATGDDDGPSGPKGKEAPSLAERVKSGELPPVEERLPKNPMVVEPVESIGKYGGTWRSAMITQEDSSWLTYAIGYDPVLRWKRDWTNSAGSDEIMPNLAESFTVSEDGRVFEFKLRDGVKWSDGTPLTMEDFRFTYEDLNVYPEMHPGGFYSMWLDQSTGKPAAFEAVDDLTLRFRFKDPKPGFLHETAIGRAEMVMPQHYFKTFHPEHNPDLDELVEQENLNDWIELFWLKANPWTNPEFPTLTAWTVTKPLGEGSAVVAERNPYYWKTDTDGSQLPYVDEFRCDVLLDAEVELLKITNGEYDLQMYHFSTVRNKPVVAEGQQKGDYRMFTVAPDRTNALIIGFNQTLQNKKRAALYANKDFRIGLSHAIDRQRVIDTIYAGQGTPWQAAPNEGSPVYDEEFGTQYTEYSTDLANEALDAAGLTERDSDGYRIHAGKKITIPVLVTASMPDHVDAMELIKADWKKVGIDMNTQRVAETLYWERVEANVAEASTWTCGDFSIRATEGSNHYYVASNPRGASRWGSTWANWYATDGAEGEEPPPSYKQALELFDEMRNTFDPDAATEIGRQIIQLCKEQFIYIGICTMADSYGIAKNNFRNVLDFHPGAVEYGAPGPNNPEHFFFSD